MHTSRSQVVHFPLILVALSALLASPTPTIAQPLKKIFDATNADRTPSTRKVPVHRWRRVKTVLPALNDQALILNLFDDLQVVARRTKVEKHKTDHYVWHGRTDTDGIATFAVVRGVMSGTVYLDGRVYEIVPDAGSGYVVNELNTAAFPTDDPVGELLVPHDLAADMAAGATGTSSTSVQAGDATANQIDVLVVWTPRARNAVGGTTDAIQSLVLSAVANANLTYSNSGVNARLRLVHSAEVSLTESSSISTDLSALTSPSDGTIDAVHTLRQQYGADVVTLLGSGYAAAGACGVGYLMATPSTSFASYAFNVVDQSCAAGYLSYAHEVGHNQGLQHDPGNAGSSPSQPYAYGYQDPGGTFRTVLSYGGANRIPYLSTPLYTYGGRVTGTASQDNARALNANASIVAAFRSAVASTPEPPTTQPAVCTFGLSSTSLMFSAGSGSSSVTVNTGTECGWTTSSGSSWAAVSGGRTGTGTAVVSVPANTGGERVATISIAGKTVTVTQKAAKGGKGAGGKNAR